MVNYPSPRTVEFYQDQNGHFPFLEWFESLEISTQVRVQNRLLRIELGNLGDCKSVGDSVFEFRLDFGPGYRIYFAQVDQVLIILLQGGDKRSQKRDISKAKEYWQDYLQRHKKTKKTLEEEDL